MDRKPYWIFLTSAMLSIVVLAGGAWFSWIVEKQNRHSAESELQAIAQLKIDQIAAWRAERLGDADALMGSVALNEEIAPWIETHDPVLEGKILKRFGVTARAYYYDRIILVSADGQILLSSTDRRGRISGEEAQAMVLAQRHQKPVLTDLYLDPDTSSPRICVASPVPTSAGAVVILECDPWQFLYPMIQSWPVPRNSSETILFRRDGDRVVYLNELHYQKKTTLNMSIPLTQVEVPSVMAVLGKKGMTIGTDYRGVEVLAYLSDVPDSPWFLITKMDTREAFAASRTQSAFIVSLVLLFLAVIFISAGFIWQRIKKEGVLQHAEKEIRQLNAALEAELADSTTKFRTLTDSSPVGFFLDDADGRAIYINKKCAELVGAPAESILNFDWSSALHPDDRERMVKGWEKAFKNITPFCMEYRWVHADGRVVWTLGEVMPILGENGKARMFVGTLTDITAAKQAEQAVHEITVALQHKNAELESFLYTASHDLKSPVVTVRTFISYLEQDVATGDSDRIAKDINFIRAAADKMAKLLEDLLELSRIGRFCGTPVRVLFQQLVDDALAAVAGQIAERGVTVTVSNGATTVFGDRTRLGEVFQNLLDNACKFMGDQKTPRIEVGNETCDEETVFFVRDNGVGIDPRFHSKVFNLFEKFESKTEGSGIGLALVKRIVELHGGRIWVESAGVGEGTCFYFTLPGEMSQTNEGEKS